MIHNESEIVNISPLEIDSLFANLLSERCERVALLTPEYAENPKAFPGHDRVFRLTPCTGFKFALVSPYLRWLTVRGVRIGDEGAKAIAASLPNLTWLGLWDCGIGDEGTKEIAASLPGLTLLDLSRNNISDDGAKAIAASLFKLTSLRLWNNQVGDGGAKAIAGSLAGLTSLDLSQNKIGDEGTKEIAESLQTLNSLDLSNNQISDIGAKAIASLHDLTSLNLSNNQIGHEGARAIATSLHGLKSLQFLDNQIGDEGAKAIAASLPGLTSLDLSSNKISDDGAKAIAASLHDLTSLQLWDNEIGDEGAKAIAASLQGLTLLDFSNNKIGDEGAKAIAAFIPGLTLLRFWDNQIGDEGAKAIAASIPGLTSLDLSSNQISDEGAEAIAATLPGLASLDLSWNQIGERGAKAIASLRNLTSLNLSNNQIGDEGSKAIAASLKGLTSLRLWGNEVGDEGAKAIAASLSGLTLLDLSSNGIGTDGARAIAASLHKLTSLLLWGNKLGDEGAKAIAASLQELNALDLSDNQIGDEGAKAIATSLLGLKSLLLSENKIGEEGAAAILEAFSTRSRSIELRELDLRENGDFSSLLPKETVESSDAQAILAAWRRFKDAREQKTAQPLNEVKLIVVGNEAVGKTSLLKYLIDGQPRDPDEPKTPRIRQHERIETTGWSPQSGTVRVNIWDFGGQEVMRGTHRFFLTDRSLYLLVLEDRRQDDLTIHEWMKTIRNRGAESPVIVVINKSDEGKKDLRLDEIGLKQAYPNIVEFLRSSCNDDKWAKDSISALRRKIIEIVETDSRLKHIRQQFPKSYLHIKDKLRELARESALLTQNQFVALCLRADHGVEALDDEDEQRAVLRLLHDLGIVVAYGLAREAPAAQREITLLDPNWLTGAIYRVIEKADSDEQRGEFARRRLSEWLDPKSYPTERHEFILSLMQHEDIGLCFRLPGLGEEAYLVPEALPRSQPPHMRKWADDSLRFRYRYRFLPPGLMPRFIVQAHEHLAPGKARWRTGVVLEACNCEALVIADRDNRKIDISIDGPHTRRRDALNILLDKLEAVHALNPEVEPEALVPLPDQPDGDVRYDHLLTLEAEEGADFEFRPEKAGNRKYKVSHLLGGVRRGRTLESRGTSEKRRADVASVEETEHLVILLHGIRTRAIWQDEIRKLLEKEGFKVEPTNYDYFDVFRFLLPWGLGAKYPVKEICRQIRHCIAVHKGARISIIAHSFGTFVVSKILNEETDISFDRIIFCGSVVPCSFRFEDHRARFTVPVLNEVGTKDFWPAFAEVATFGYGDTGTYGFRRGAVVRDRWHNGKNHSDFLNADFCKKYWIPFLQSGMAADNDEKAEPPPGWLWLLSTFKLKYLFCVAAFLAIYIVWR